jgi:hypothetical protein
MVRPSPGAGAGTLYRVKARFLLLLTPAGFEDFTRACGYPATAPTMPTPDLPQRDTRVLAAAARTHGIDIVETP